MKRPLVITIGIGLILVVLGIWVYLLLFGAPDESNEVFSNLGFDIEPREAVIVETEIVEEDDYIVDVGSGLQQLTTRAVAGFEDAVIASSSIIRYAEQGTGHIYEIDLDTGEESAISLTTIPRVRQAKFSPDADKVALTSINGYETNTFAGNINLEMQTVAGETLAPNAKNITFTDASQILYTISSQNGQVGYEYDLDEGELKERFTTPFTQTVVDWGEQTYVFNKLAESLQGYLYKISGGTYSATNISGYGLTAEVGEKFIAYSTNETDGYFSKFQRISDGVEFDSPVLIIPEKCAFLKNSTSTNPIWCASSLNAFEGSIEAWYQGKQISKDYLWSINPETSTAILVADFNKLSGRTIDVIDLTINEEGETLFFRNKIDNTLWKLDI